MTEEERQLQVNFRMPEGLKQKLETSAKEGGRSLTAEIVERLVQSFRAVDEQQKMQLLQMRAVQAIIKGTLLQAKESRTSEEEEELNMLAADIGKYVVQRRSKDLPLPKHKKR